MQEDTKQLNVIISNELHRSIRMEAAKQGITIAQFVTGAITEKLGQEKDDKNNRARKIKIATGQRKFTIVYDDFLKSRLLNHYEKSVFIALKRYMDNDTMKAFPSINNLHEITGISISQIKRCIGHMKKLGVISVEHRMNNGKEYQSNLYTLHDYPEIWNINADDDEEQVMTTIREISEAKLIEKLRSRGTT